MTTCATPAANAVNTADTADAAHLAMLPTTPSLATQAAQAVVIDTQIVLDLLLFNDPAAAPLRAALASGQLRWIATAHMRNELERVLHYPHIASRVAFYQRQPADILAQRDALIHHTHAPAPRCPYICKDPDDQCFIDLAVAHQALLLSKDKQVLKLRKRLAKQGITASSQWAQA